VPEAAAAGEKARREALETPAFVVVMTAVGGDETIREEDFAAAMMAIENLMIAAEALGLGTYLRTGGSCVSPPWRSWLVSRRGSGSPEWSPSGIRPSRSHLVGGVPPPS
jgi:hypothetical protein